MMGTQRKAEHGVIQSSIALLQERFKQLQQVKEMREKRELLRMFSDYKNTTTTTTATTTTISSTTTTTNSNNNNNNIPSDHRTMQYNYEPPHDDVDDDLQIFLPPNYYHHHHHHHKPKPSSYASSLSSSTTTSSTTSPSSNCYHINQYNQNNYCNDVSLSLWPATSCNNNKVNLGQRTSLEVPISTRSFLRPPTMEISTSSTTCAFKLEDYSHVSDVDTTLHL